METTIYKSFWSDPEIEVLPREIKLCALWLMTNPRLTICGYSESSEKRLALETDLTPEHLASTLEALPKTFVRVGKGIWVRNYIRYNFGDVPTLAKSNVTKGIIKALERSESPELRELVYDEYAWLRRARDESLRRGLLAPSKGQEQSKAGQGRAEHCKAEGGAGGNNSHPQPSHPEPHESPTDAMIQSAFDRLNAMFSSPRKKCRAGSEAHRALLDELPIPEEDWELLAWFYGRPPEEKNFALGHRRHDPVALACNLSREIAKARRYRQENPDFSTAKKNRGPEPQGWQDRVRKKFPAAEVPDHFAELPRSMREDPFISGVAPNEEAA